MVPASFASPAMAAAAAAAKSLQSCLTLCNPIDGSPPGSPIPKILQARTLEWAAISFSNAWKWKVKGKSLSRVWLLAPHGLQPTRLFYPWDFLGKSTSRWILYYEPNLSVSQIILHESSGQSEWVAALLTAYPTTIHCILFTKRIPILFIFLTAKCLNWGYVPS